MPTIAELKRTLNQYKDDDACAWSLWLAEDVKTQAEAMNKPEPTPEQIADVLERTHDKQDANCGINWDVLDYHIQDVCR